MQMGRAPLRSNNYLRPCATAVGVYDLRSVRGTSSKLAERSTISVPIWFEVKFKRKRVPTPSDDGTKRRNAGQWKEKTEDGVNRTTKQARNNVVDRNFPGSRLFCTWEAFMFWNYTFWSRVLFSRVELQNKAKLRNCAH